MKVRLTRKYADQIDGIDLSGHQVGDVLDLTPEKARTIIAEEWAHADRREALGSGSEHRRRADDQPPEQRSQFPEEDQRALAADRPRNLTQR